MTHYHIRWSGQALLDWQCFSTPEEAKASARQLVRQGETYIIEEHDEACARCQAAMNVKSMHSSFQRGQRVEISFGSPKIPAILEAGLRSVTAELASRQS